MASATMVDKDGEKDKDTSELLDSESWRTRTNASKYQPSDLFKKKGGGREGKKMNSYHFKPLLPVAWVLGHLVLKAILTDQTLHIYMVPSLHQHPIPFWKGWTQGKTHVIEHFLVTDMGLKWC